MRVLASPAGIVPALSVAFRWWGHFPERPNGRVNSRWAAGGMGALASLWKLVLVAAASVVLSSAGAPRRTSSSARASFTNEAASRLGRSG